jgi:hypothetical protein
MAETPKIEENISVFFDAFNKMGSDEKLYFLAEIDKATAGKSGKEKSLYLALIKAAREGKSCEEAVAELRRA